jgi:hypothetical protein
VRVIHKIAGEWSEGISLGEYAHNIVKNSVGLSILNVSSNHPIGKPNPSQRQSHLGTYSLQELGMVGSMQTLPTRLAYMYVAHGLCGNFVNSLQLLEIYC